jgi:RHS repeat-associated protein
MREYAGNGAINTLYYLHQDHLGSTSLTTTSGGAEYARQGYLPYGEVRFSTGATAPTTIGFTGQRRDSGLGSLMFYNARYYSSYLNRFVQADTIVPGAGNSQSLNRYSYVLNRPVILIDPSGHIYMCVDECDNGGWGPSLIHYGVVLTGSWSVEHAFAVLNGVSAFAQKVNEVTGMIPVEAFRAVFDIDDSHPMIFDFDINCSDCRPKDCGDSYSGGCKPAFGHTDNGRRIEFASMSAYSNRNLPDNGAAQRALRQRNNVVHELGHAFENAIAYQDASGRWHKPAREALLFANRDGLATGIWRQSGDPGSGEIYADMVLGWTFNTWATQSGGLTKSGQAYQQWMNSNMPLWIDAAVNR